MLMEFIYIINIVIKNFELIIRLNRSDKAEERINKLENKPKKSSRIW